MKRWMKTLLAGAVMSTACCLTLASAAFAEVRTGEEGKAFRWMFDSDTGTMRVQLWNDETLPTKDYAGWSAFSGQIKQIVGTSVEQEAVSGVKSGDWYGISWEVNASNKTLTLKGRGEIPYCYWLVWSELWPYADRIDRIVIDDGITAADDSLNALEAKTVYLGKDVKPDGGFSMLASLSYEVSAENPWITVYEKLVYTKDYTKLVACPSELERPNFHTSLKVIGKGALDSNNIDFQRVLPWGVTTLEANPEISGFLVFPNTVTVIPREGGAGTTANYICSYYNQAVRSVIEATPPAEWEGYYRGNRRFSYDGYYGISPNQWKTLNGEKYYFVEAPGWYGRPEARMVTGWYTIGDKDYYFDETGVLRDERQAEGGVRNQWQEIDGKKYYIGADGEKLTGWQQVDGAWYCFSDTGEMRANQWIKWRNNWYFVRPNGTMAVNSWIKWNGQWYYTEANGVMPAGKWVERFGCWYYFHPSGVMSASQWIKGRDGSWYYTRANGEIAHQEWANANGKRYYLGADGVMVTNSKVTYSRHDYYVDQDGVMAANAQTPYGWAGADGKIS